MSISAILTPEKSVIAEEKCKTGLGHTARRRLLPAINVETLKSYTRSSNKYRKLLMFHQFHSRGS